MDNCRNKEYVALLLEENLENLTISGVDFLSEEAVKKVQEMLEKENSDLQKNLKIDKKNL